MGKRYIIITRYSDSLTLGEFGPFISLETAENAVLESIRAGYDLAIIKEVDKDYESKILDESEDEDN